MGDRTLHHHAAPHWPYIYHYRTHDRGVRLARTTYGGQDEGTCERVDGGTDTYTGMVWVGMVLSVLGHAWCLRWAELHIRVEET